MLLNIVVKYISVIKLQRPEHDRVKIGEDRVSTLLITCFYSMLALVFIKI